MESNDKEKLALDRIKNSPLRVNSSSSFDLEELNKVYKEVTKNTLPIPKENILGYFKS